ncbi:MAG: 4-alpha-glucanotransferase [Acetobacteraceae bacterium]|nr:4-alpha-glucanotransferase [Acetobacteraceae bacterium]
MRALAEAAGVAVEWHNYAGEPREVSPDALRRVLATLGFPCETSSDIAESRERLAPSPGLAGLPPLVTAIAGTTTRLPLGSDAARHALLLTETGGERDVRLRPSRAGVEMPVVSEPGYHRLLIGEREIVLAVAPERATGTGEVAEGARPWGLAAQIYGLRRAGDGGVGDAQCVAELAASAARLGADMLALSPVHALFPAEPHRFGPYSPSSRLFLNPLHGAPALMFESARVAAAAAQAGAADELARLETLELIDWPAAAHAKLALLRALFAQFSADGDIPDALRADFAQFQADGGELLADHARFEAIQAEQVARDPGLGDWRSWASDLRDARGPAVDAFAQAHRREVLFHVFLQWVADRSLAAAQHQARQAGMRIGLVADLAVGMDPTGSHAWSRPGDILNGLSIGAPPDLFNPNGQQWGITSFSPQALRAGGFAPFLATLRAALRNAGGVRIDHAMGLQRLWVVPDGVSPADGAYLKYPLTDMLRLLALESHRHRAVVVGEDLGTVPEGFRHAFDQHGIHGMRVLWFERDDGGFAKPARWDRGAMAMTSTHDLPTLAGWWQGADIALRAEHGVLGPDQDRADLEAERETDRAALWQAITRSGAASGPQPDQADRFVDAALRHVAGAACALCLLPLEDVLGQVEQPNLPGTTDEHPNWRRRMPQPAADLLDEPRVAERLKAVAAARAREGRP